MILSLLLAALLLLGMLAAAVITSQKRRTALRRLAESNGWRWASRDDDAYAGLSGRPFGPASGRRAQQVLRGTHRGRPFVAFDYSWMRWSSDGQGRQRTTVGRAAVCVLTLPTEHTPTRLGPRRGRRLRVRVDGSTLCGWRMGVLTTDTIQAHLDALSDIADTLDTEAAGTLAG